MSKSNVNIEETARRYAKALFLVSNSDKLNTLETRKSFDEFIKLFNSLSELRFFFKSPLTNPGKKKNINKKSTCKNKSIRKFFKFLGHISKQWKTFFN